MFTLSLSQALAHTDENALGVFDPLNAQNFFIVSSQLRGIVRELRPRLRGFLSVNPAFQTFLNMDTNKIT